jgi:hypothetical protein
MKNVCGTVIPRTTAFLTARAQQKCGEEFSGVGCRGVTATGYSRLKFESKIKSSNDSAAIYPLTVGTEVSLTEVSKL